MTFLALDVGNTRLKWALYDQARSGAALLGSGAEFLENIDKLTEGAWLGMDKPDCMLGCIVAGDAIKRRVAFDWPVSTSRELRAQVVPSYPLVAGRSRLWPSVGRSCCEVLL